MYFAQLLTVGCTLHFYDRLWALLLQLASVPESESIKRVSLYIPPSSSRLQSLLGDLGEPLCEVADLLGARRVLHAGVRLELEAGALEDLVLGDGREAELLEELDRLDAV